MTDPDAEPIDAQGDGAELFDAPTSFYLTHRQSIEAWHSLKRVADRAVHEFLSSLADPIAELALTNGWEPRFLDFGGRYYAHGVLAVGPDGPDGPALVVGLGWQHKEVRPDQDTNAPYVGIRVASGAPELRAWLMDVGQPTMRERRDAIGDLGDRRWPVYRYVPALPGWWGDLDGYRERCLRQLTDFIDDHRSAIGAARTHLGH